MLKQRVLSALILIPVVGILAWLGGWWFAGLMAVAAGLATWELLRMLGKNEAVRPCMALGIPVAILLVLEASLPPNPVRLQALLGISVLAGLTLALFLKRKNAPTDLLITLGAAFYLGLTLRFLSLLRLRSDGLMWLTVVAVTVWVMDTGAYFVGITWGKHRLLPRVSPKKSWEGFFGGLASAMLGAALMAHFWLPGVSAWQGALLGGVIGVVGPLGDLSESLFKRQAGVKDSSQLIPGHGGVFDRLDSFVFVAPTLYLLTQLLGW